MDPLKKMEELEKRIKALESAPVLNPQKGDPSTASFLQDFIALPYTTAAPAGTPNVYGYQRLIVVGGTAAIYAFTPLGWLKTQLT
jgi:hypothetical protein